MSSEAETDMDLHLQIIQKTQNKNSGELSREVSENCYTYRINEKSALYDHVMFGRPVMREYTDVNMLNPVPTLIEDRSNRYIVFSHCHKCQSVGMTED